MPAPRGLSEWPSVSERRTYCVVQFATPTTDSMGGRGEPTWTQLGVAWYAKVNDIPFIVNETQADVLYEVEGPYRSDMWTYYTDGIGLRIVASDRTLKVFQLRNPLLRNRTLVAHCAEAVNT